MRLTTLGLLAVAVTRVIGVGPSWGFEDASLSINTKGAGVGAGTKHKLSPDSVLPSAVSLGAQDTLKLVLTSVRAKGPTEPHQAFLTLHDPQTGLEESFMFQRIGNARGKVEITQKDLPFQFLDTDAPLIARVVIGGWGTSQPFNSKVFTLTANRDPAVASPAPPGPRLRYGSLPEIHHVFKAGPKSPPLAISGFFALAVAATLPILLGVWMYLGANLDHAGQAMKSDPLSHGLFYGSIVVLEGVFFLYYTTWNLFQTLPVAAVLGVVAVVSGSRALSEVQARRLAGQR